MIHAARDLLAHALDEGVDFSDFTCLLDIKELVARIETDMARNHDRHELEVRGASTHTAHLDIHDGTPHWIEHLGTAHRNNSASAQRAASRHLQPI
ncbi:hypothetical protein QVA66_07145 [Staphylococcus chromogenes]|nr:hypothetical protein [Staphylococcus chromogenes]